MAKIRIMLADDHTLFRQGIRTLISAEPDMEVVGEASNGGDAVDKANEARPDVVLMDIGMPGLSSFEATRQIKKNRPETKVLFLTMYDDEDYLVEGMEVGASGYVLKDSPSQQLVAAVRDVCRGGSYLSPRMLSQLVDDFRSRIKSANRLPRFATLTTREREVLKMLAEGQGAIGAVRDPEEDHQDPEPGLAAKRPVGQLVKLRPIVNRPRRAIGTRTAAVGNRRAGYDPAPHSLQLTSFHPVGYHETGWSIHNLIPTPIRVRWKCGSTSSARCRRGTRLRRRLP